jgi:hypothetical protein
MVMRILAVTLRADDEVVERLEAILALEAVEPEHEKQKRRQRNADNGEA